MKHFFAFKGTARQLINLFADAELFPELHPFPQMPQWQKDGTEQAIAYARKHGRERLYQLYTNDLAD